MIDHFDCTQYTQGWLGDMKNVKCVQSASIRPIWWNFWRRLWSLHNHQSITNCKHHNEVKKFVIAFRFLKCMHVISKYTNVRVKKMRHFLSRSKFLLVSRRPLMEGHRVRTHTHFLIDIYVSLDCRKAISVVLRFHANTGPGRGKKGEMKGCKREPMRH